MANGFELNATSARVGKLVYASNPKLPGIITALLGGRWVRVSWLSGRVSEQSYGGLYDLELRIDSYAADLADYQLAVQQLLARPHP